MSTKLPSWTLTLYVSGNTSKSLTAISNLRLYSAENLDPRYQVEIIDLNLNPAFAERDQILAIPTLVRKVPKPVRKIIGDLSDKEKVLSALDCRKVRNKK